MSEKDFIENKATNMVIKCLKKPIIQPDSIYNVESFVSFYMSHFISTLFQLVN